LYQKREKEKKTTPKLMKEIAGLASNQVNQPDQTIP